MRDTKSVKRCLSAKKLCIVAAWVWVGGGSVDCYDITHQQHFLVSYCVGGSFIISVFQHKSSDRCHCLAMRVSEEDFESWLGGNGSVGE